MVKNTMKGIRRTLGTAPVQKSPTLTDDIRAMVDAADAGLIGTRDRALILLGFAGAFRRSELVALDIEDCTFGKDGLTVTLRRSKTDQQAAGRKIGIPYGSNPETCPVRMVQAWLEAGGSQRRPAVPLDQPARASAAGSVVADRRGARGEEAGGARGPGRGEVCGPLAAGRPCDQCRDRGRVRAVDHEPDRASERTDGAALHSGREPVPGEQRGEARAVKSQPLNAKITSGLPTIRELFVPLFSVRLH